MNRRADVRGGATSQKLSGGDALAGYTRTHPEHVTHACVSLLSRKRPMVLCWGRHGRVGGCQIYGGLAQLGEHLPCKQGVESSNLLVSTIAMSSADRNRCDCLGLHGDRHICSCP